VKKIQNPHGKSQNPHGFTWEHMEADGKLQNPDGTTWKSAKPTWVSIWIFQLGGFVPGVSLNA